MPSQDKQEESIDQEKGHFFRKRENKKKKPSLVKAFAVTPVKGFDWKLILCAALGGAITIYVCMFVFRYKLNNLFLMIILPILGAANAYLWFTLLTARFFMRTWQKFTYTHVRKRMRKRACTRRRIVMYYNYSTFYLKLQIYEGGNFLLVFDWFSKKNIFLIFYNFF